MIKVWEIEIEEKLKRVVKVEADTIEEALSKAEDDYCDRKIVLNDDDLVFWGIEQYRGI